MTTTETILQPSIEVSTLKLHAEPEDGAKNRLAGPIKLTGLLDKYAHADSTPVIGRSFPDLQVKEWLKLPKDESDALFRELAATISRRGVIFLRAQEITPQEMKLVGERISEQGGSPKSSGLHVHPLTEESSELGDEVQVISSEKQAKGGGLLHIYDDRSRYASAAWHSDVSFEPVPSDYAMLKIHTLPPCGGDTLWASGYEAYDRLSPAMATMLEGLTATHSGAFFHDEARRLGNPLRAGVRGSPLNHGTELEAVHPVIRTNPVTGWKSIFVNKVFTKRIIGVTRDESDFLISYLHSLVFQNHDLQVRLQYGKNDMAIWDNRSTWHTATYDYAEARAGDRVCSLGERPYLDSASSGRREALAAEL